MSRAMSVQSGPVLDLAADHHVADVALEGLK
jgi:hypothetical protein